MWKPDEVKPITAIAAETDELKAYYSIKDTSMGTFTEITEPFTYNGNNVHTLHTSFPAGDYLLRINNLTTGGVLYLDLYVGLDIWARDTNVKLSRLVKKINLESPTWSVR